MRPGGREEEKEWSFGGKGSHQQLAGACQQGGACAVVPLSVLELGELRGRRT